MFFFIFAIALILLPFKLFIKWMIKEDREAYGKKDEQVTKRKPTKNSVEREYGIIDFSDTDGGFNVNVIDW